MKKLAIMAMISFALAALIMRAQPLTAAEFFCLSGDVTCLIDSINEANGMPGEDNIIKLEPGIFTLRTVNNTIGGENGLPSIMGSIRIQSSAEDPPTVILRDPNAPSFRIFHVSLGGKLELSGITLEGGFLVDSGGTIFNLGFTLLEDTRITGSLSDPGAIFNMGTLHLSKSIIVDSDSGLGGVIFNFEGSVLLETSTIARNISAGGTGISNIRGILVVSDSAIIFNRTDRGQGGAAILNSGGTVEIFNSTIAKNIAGALGGAVWNGDGEIFIVNSTIRENQALVSEDAGGIVNASGTVTLQNTILAGNAATGNNFPFSQDCSGTIISVGNNLFGDLTLCDVNLQQSDLIGDPGLDSLAGAEEDNLPGAPHYPILAGSVIIDRGGPDACPETDQLGNPRAGNCDIGAIESQDKLAVYVDVRPRSDANKINPNSANTINVAIFSVNGFDATTVDSNTVRFGATGTEAAPIHVGRRDVDADGDRDMVMRFRIQDTGISCGDISALLTGQIARGASIVGSTPIKTVQCRQKKVKPGS